MPLDTDSSTVAKLATWLTPWELQRANAFRFARECNYYIVCRGRLREFLAERLGCGPGQVDIRCTELGKPYIPSSRIRFNVSHSGNLAFYAIAADLEVGCDIEWREPHLASAEIAASLFSPLENQALSTLHDGQWVQGFFNCWTRREAVLKGCGLGLWAPPADFAVSLLPGEPALILRGARGWSISSFEPLHGLHAVVATKATMDETTLPKK